MGTAGFWIFALLSTLVLSSDSEAAVHDGWSEIGVGFLAEIMLQTPTDMLQTSEIGPSLPIPFPIWNLMDIKSNFNLRLMNSSWSGPAETNFYQKGELVYLQVSGSTAPDQALYIQSCYATSSLDPMDKSRSALILNNGCTSSKQSAMEFISRQGDSIDLLLDAYRLKFSQVYVHCSVVLSSAVTPNTKSCNYNRSKSSWVELSGKKSVCKCCASKCKGPPSYGGPSNELKALVSTGPITFREEGESSLFFNITSQAHSKTTSSKETRQVVNDWKSLIPDRVSEVFMADSPGLMNDWDLADAASVEFPSLEEELRGDVFMDYKWPRHYDTSNGDLHMDALTSPLLVKLPEKNDVLGLEQTEVLESKTGEFGSLEYVKKTKFTFSQDLGGLSSLSYEKDEERRPNVGEQEVRMSKLGMDWGKLNKKERSKELEKDLIHSVLDLVRSLNKMIADR